MAPPERIGRFLLLTTLIYGIMMVPWPGLESGYAACFRALHNVAFARFWFWPDGGVRFLDPKNLKPGDLAPGTPEIEAVGTFDTVMELRNRRSASIGYLRTSSRYIAYGPTVLVVALILATPMARGRKIRALVGGFLLVHLFIALRLTLTLTATGFAADKPYALFHPGPFWSRVLVRAESIFSDDPTVSFVVPAAIWFLTAVRRSGWKANGRPAQAPSSGPQ